jgi:hypothetical protein
MTKKKTTTALQKINLITKDLFPSVKKDDILHWEGRTFVLKGKPVSPETMKGLVAQAKVIKELDLFKLLMDEMTELGQRKIFEDTQTVEDMKVARTILWTIDVLQKKIDKLSRM